MKKRILAILLCMLMACSLFSGCTPDGAGDTPNSSPGNPGTAATNDADGNGIYDSIVYALAACPADLSPWNTRSGTKPPVYTCIYECLYDFIDGEYVPRLAKGAPVEIDDLHATVEIYDYITDSQGNHITAADVVAAYNRFIDAGFVSKFSYYDSIKQVGDYTVEFTWAQPLDAIQPLDHVLCAVPIYSDAAYTEDFATMPIATGPYTVESFVSGSRTVVVRREDYWQQDESLYTAWQYANVDKITFDVITESSQCLVALKNGTIDFTYSIPSENYADFENSDVYKCADLSGNSFWYLLMNQSEGNPLADKNLRLALYYAIDNEQLSAAIYGTRPNKNLGSNASPDYESEWDEMENYMSVFDQELAKEYLAKSGYKGETLRLMTGNVETRKTTAEMLQAYWEAIGVHCTIDTVEVAMLNASNDTADTWDIMINNCGGDFWISQLNKLVNAGEHSGEYALGFIKDDKLQELYDIANNPETWNKENRTKLMEYIIDNAYHYVMFTFNISLVVTQDCTSFEGTPTYVYPNCCTYDLG